MTSLRLISLCLLVIVTAIYATDGYNNYPLKDTTRVTATKAEGCRQTWLERVMGCECGGGKGVGRYGFICPTKAEGGQDGDKEKKEVGEVFVQGDGYASDDGQRRDWVEGGGGWSVRVELRTWPHAPSVSPLDWFMRWNSTKQCLASHEWDNADNFEIDEVALKFFWDRVWGCFLEYASGGSEQEMSEPARKTSNEHGLPELSPRQSNQGLSMAEGMHALRPIVFALTVWVAQFAMDVFVWWTMFMLDLLEAIVELFYPFLPGLF